jgi:hypothetical protein
LSGRHNVFKGTVLINGIFPFKRNCSYQVYGKIRDASLRIAGELMLYFVMYMHGLRFSTVRSKALALSATLFSSYGKSHSTYHKGQYRGRLAISPSYLRAKLDDSVGPAQTKLLQCFISESTGRL